MPIFKDKIPLRHELPRLTSARCFFSVGRMSNSHAARTAEQVLREFFGLETFRGLQEPVIRSVLAQKSALAVFPTGAGKSLCYQVPALLLDGLTLVVSPLIALMKDQVEKLQSLGIPAARVDSTLADDEVEEIFSKIHAGELRLLYLSPERLAASAFRKRLKGVKIPLLAIDEAHCISEWGHNFRPDYLKIAALSRRLGVGCILALTATATSGVARDIRKGFRIAKSAHYQADLHRPNLQLRITACTDGEKDALLVEKLRDSRGPVIVYATTRNDTERIATMLQKEGFAAKSYHAGLTPEMRTLAQDGFMGNSTMVIVATIAFGMGIDKADIRTIIHYHLPKCMEGYCQEIGRSGRDGLPAHCELFACAADTRTLENFIHGSTPSRAALKNLLDRILRLAVPGRSFAISPYELAVTHDMREETVRTVLAYLELDGIISRSGSFHCHLRVKPLRTLDQIVAGCAKKEQLLVRKLFGAAESAYGSLHFKLYEIATSTGISREKSLQIITDLADAGDIRLEQRGLREVFLMNKKWDASIAPVIENITDRFEARAQFEFARIRSVVKYAESRKCRVRFISDYFGMKSQAPCGVCDLCQGGKPLRMPDRSTAPVPADEWSAMLALREENHAALGTPLQLARFMCGIHSPAAYQARLQNRGEFGMWRNHRFTTILQMLEA